MRNLPQPFVELIAPTSPEHFFSDHWEKRHLHISGRDRHRFEHFFSLRDIDRWCMTTRSGDRDSVLLITSAQSGQGMKAETRKFRPRDIKVDGLYEAFNNGQSIVLNRLEDSWLPIAPLVETLGAVFCGEIGVNVYLTPKNAQTFPVHVDDHDVFVLQVHGEKVWRLHELRMLSIDRLPLKNSLKTTADWGAQRLAAPLQAEILLRPGDLLFIPRGMPHCAIAQETSSLHITVSITPLYWTDFLKAAIEQATISCADLRKALPPRFVGDLDAAEAMRDEWANVFEQLARAISFDDTLDVLRRNRLQAQGLPRDGHFAHLERAQEVTTSSLLERRPGVLCVVEAYEADDFATIRFAARSVRGARRLLKVFEFVRDHEQFRVSEMPGLDADGQIVMARRLIKEGLLRFAEKTHRADSKGEPGGSVGRGGAVKRPILAAPARARGQKGATQA